MVMQNSCRVFADLVVIFISKYLPSVLFWMQQEKDMESLKSPQLQRYEDLFDAIKGFRTRYFSDMSKRLYSLLLFDKLRVSIEEVEYYIEKGKTELLMNVGVDFSYAEISNDRRWDIKDEGKSLMVPNKERSSYNLLGDNVITAEYIKNVTESFDFNEKALLMKESVNDVEFRKMMEAIGSRNIVSDRALENMITTSINTLRAKMAELDTILCNPDEALCEDLYDNTFLPMRILKQRAEVNKTFESWKSIHLKNGNKDVKISRLDDYLIECMIELFKTDVLDKVERVKSRAELKDFKEDINFEDFPTEGIDCKSKYLLLIELLDCSSKSKKNIPIYKPNKENIGRFLYNNRHTLSQEGKNQLVKFILMMQHIQEEKIPKGNTKDLNYEAVIINMNNKYFKACEKLLLEDYNMNWLDNYINALMSSEHKDGIANDWAKNNRRKKVACFILGALVDGGVLTDNYADVAKAIYDGKEKGDKKEKKLRTLANYIGQGKKQALGDWTKEYIEGK